MRILITGSRTWSNEAVIENEIATVMYENKVGASCYVTLVVGGARGADQIAQKYGEEAGMHIELHAADWDRYGKAAGPIRNQEMVDSGADICLAFIAPGSKGARDCADRAKKAGIEVREFYSE